MPRNTLGARRWNDLEDRIYKRVVEIMDTVEEKLLSDGYPPFHEPLSDRQQYETLLAMRDANADSFWNDPQAIATFTRLAVRYGPPPAPGAAIPAYPQPNPFTPVPPPVVP